MAIKTVRQTYYPNAHLKQLFQTFRFMVNDCITIGLEDNVSAMKRLCQLSYPKLEKYDIISYYKLCAISRAAGILASRKKSNRRGVKTKIPYFTKPLLVSCYGFKIREDILQVPIGSKQYFNIPLNKHTRRVLSDSQITVRSFTLTDTTVSISYSKEVKQQQCTKMAGIDRNLYNITTGNCENATQYDLSKVVKIVENTRSIIRSFKRNDVRIRRKIAAKYGKRRKNRINQMLHHVSKSIVKRAKTNSETLVFEDIRNIRRMYQKGNGQGSKYRGTMNSWSFSEIKRQIEYKAAWEGVSIIQLSVSSTRGTSSLCPRCGERLQVGQTRRMLYCSKCKRELDRDVVAVMNLSLKGRSCSAFDRSKGDAGEAVKGNTEKEPLILRVDASKLNRNIVAKKTTIEIQQNLKILN